MCIDSAGDPSKPGSHTGIQSLLALWKMAFKQVIRRGDWTRVKDGEKNTQGEPDRKSVITGSTKQAPTGTMFDGWREKNSLKTDTILEIGTAFRG